MPAACVAREATGAAEARLLHAADWTAREVKICKDSGLTINQSKVIKGENYIVVNYKANSIVKSVWVLWEAQDRFQRSA